MKKVYKYEIGFEDNFELELPKGSKILTVRANQKTTPCIWVLVNPDEKQMEKRKFRHAGTGHSITEENLEYIGTYPLRDGFLIFHLFEVKE